MEHATARTTTSNMAGIRKYRHFFGVPAVAVGGRNESGVIACVQE
jgi:hypothetical protein